MRIIVTWRSTTMFYGTVGAVFLHFSGANAADMFTKAPLAQAPVALGAVDGVNGKVEGFGGSLANSTFWGGAGSVSTPLGNKFNPYGLQIDGAAGKLDGRSISSVGGHLFWRDPSRGLIGLYGDYTHWNQYGGVGVGRVAGEGAWYNNRWTIEGIAGVEFGGSTNIQTGDPVNGFFVQGFDVKTRFFDKINVAYYLTNDLKGYLGHRYLGGQNALALGGEWLTPLKFGAGNQVALFAEGRVGQHDYHGIWGGVRVYFGQRDKSLIDRHRQDDPFLWAPEGLMTIVGNATKNYIAGTGAPPPPPPPPPPDGGS